MKSLGLLLSTIFVFGQVYLWRGHAHEMAWLSLVTRTPWAGTADFQRASRICLKLRDADCAVDYLERLLERSPNLTEAQGELGMALARLGRHRQAIVHFKRFLDKGGRSAEVLHSFGMSLIASGHWPNGISRLYQAVKMNPNQTKFAADLTDSLMVAGRSSEALSLIGALTAGRPERDLFWQAKLEVISRSSSAITDSQESRIRLAGIVPGEFYLPARKTRNETFRFWRIETKVSPSRQLAGQESSTFQVGSWRVQFEEPQNCEDCERIINAEVLKDFENHRYFENGWEYFELSRRR